jgi:endonuclease YncB( thermonuclease family)
MQEKLLNMRLSSTKKKVDEESHVGRHDFRGGTRGKYYEVYKQGSLKIVNAMDGRKTNSHKGQSMVRKERVTEVIDGDTFKTSRRKHAVRLADVDAPEKGRPGAKQATEALRKMIEGKEVAVETVARDKYGRSVAKVKVGRESVNKKMKSVVGE